MHNESSPNQVYGPDNCPCPKIKCKRHGHCVECREHHGKRGPRCERLK